MARQGDDNDGKGLALEDFSKTIPPGWKPLVRGYTFRKYMQKLRLWWRITDEDREERIGPLIVSRLKSTPFRQAMSFTIVRDGVTYRGDEAVSLPAVAEDQARGVQAEHSGIRQFLDVMKGLYELHDQDRVGIVLDAYFDCRRGNSDLPQWIAQQEMAFDDAVEEGGLQMNAVGRSHFLLKNSDLAEKKLDDVKLHVGGDLSQYPAIRGLLMRMGKQDQSNSHGDWAFYGGINEDDDDGEYDLMEIWYEAYSTEDYEWGWDDNGWSATTDGEWYYMADDDI